MSPKIVVDSPHSALLESGSLATSVQIAKATITAKRRARR
jgi:hypothetical protein